MAKATLVREKKKQKRIRPNKLNDLTGKEWIKFTKTWFIPRALARDRKIIHPASFPERLAKEFIGFFTKNGEWVLDPFLGTGSSLIAAKELGRNAIGIELYPKYVQSSIARLEDVPDNKTITIVKQGDSRNLSMIISDEKLPKIDFCITSPPYWNQLSQNHRRQRKRKKLGLDTTYGEMIEDLGVIDDYEFFLKEQRSIFDQTYDLMKDGGYLVVITNNIYKKGRIWPLAFDTFRDLSEKWVPKDEKIWCQDDRSLFPFGIFDTYVGNRAHHYCLIFKKDQSN